MSGAQSREQVENAANEAARAAIAAGSSLIEALKVHGLSIVPTDPPKALLISMLLRFDHGALLPQPLSRQGRVGIEDARDRTRRLRSQLDVMRQLHEEIVGDGFYNDDSVQMYLSDDPLQHPAAEIEGEREAAQSELTVHKDPSGSLRLVPPPGAKVSDDTTLLLARVLSGAIDIKLVEQTILWMKTRAISAGQGRDVQWPDATDLAASSLLRRIRHGRTPLPFAPPTSFREPWYEIIEQAHKEHPVIARVTDKGGSLPEITINETRWNVIAVIEPGIDYDVQPAGWPLRYRLHLTKCDERWTLRCISRRNLDLYIRGTPGDLRGQDILSGAQVIELGQHGRPISFTRQVGTAGNFFTAYCEEVAWDETDQVARYLVWNIPEGEDVGAIETGRFGRTPLNNEPVPIVERDAGGRCRLYQAMLKDARLSNLDLLLSPEAAVGV